MEPGHVARDRRSGRPARGRLFAPPVPPGPRRALPSYFLATSSRYQRKQDRVRRRDRRHLRERLPTEFLPQHCQLPSFGVSEPQPLLSRPLHQRAVHRPQVLDLVRLMARDPHAYPCRQELKRQRQCSGSCHLLTPHGSPCTPPDLLRKALVPPSRRPRFLDGFPRSAFCTKCRPVLIPRPRHPAATSTIAARTTALLCRPSRSTTVPALLPGE